MIYLDQSKIVIKQYESIITLETHCILLKMSKCMLKMIGDDFIVVYLSREEIHVRGVMKEVKFIYA